MKEGNVQAEILLATGAAGARLFRNQVGTYKLQDGTYLSSGLCAGSSDLIGWTPLVITPDMVGRTVAIFTAIEVKKPKGRRPTDGQENFIARVREAGGKAGVARSAADAIAIIAPRAALL